MGKSKIIDNYLIHFFLNHLNFITMATIKKNLFLTGASGMLGNQLVYRNVNGKLVVSSKPISTKTSEGRRKQNKRFKYATMYAKAALDDERLGPIYTEAASRLSSYNSAYQLALTDYLRSPEVGDLSFVSGSSGNSLLVEAFEDPMINSVTFRILNEDEEIVEEGEATITMNGIQWEYVLQNEIPEGAKVSVVVTDLPGNISNQTFEL